MNNELLYLDHAAATPLDERVLAAMQPYFSDAFVKPSAPYMQAVDVRRAYEEAKDNIGRIIGGRGDEIIMTAGATESINLAIRGTGG
ncbi:MAG TPA: aminotransferase class V-fold PLP-dependent enzyme, partial [Candidatus Saccharibacteria bacterium]|nr:aminotransferase class V-fold PLP-dependent enzyme [Candidatus Saccharibacteria bacterium]